MMSFKNFLDVYVALAGERSIRNDKMNIGMFLSVVSAAIHKRGIRAQFRARIDLRLSTLLVQESRTGKGVSLNIIADLCQLLEASFVQELQMTDAALVGTIDSKIHQRNRDKGYDFEDPNFVDPLILGDLGLFDVIAFPEAKMMFKTGPHAEDKLEIFQMAMDSPGRVRKKLSLDVPIEYPTGAVFIGTTYYLEEFQEILLNQGIFQRLFILIENVDADERKIRNRELVSGPTVEEYNRFDDRLVDLGNDLSRAIKSFDEGHIVTADEEGKVILQKLSDQLVDQATASFKGKELDLILPYTTGALNIHFKLASIAAILNGTGIVGRKEVMETKPLVDMYFSAIGNDIITRVSGMGQGKLHKMIRGIVAAEPKGLTGEQIKKEVEKRWHVSRQKSSLAIREMIKNKELNRSKTKGIITINR